MCGITGILEGSGRTGDSAEAVGVMTDALTHRGPDARGVWSDDQAGIHLGHRRLAILDLSRDADQPMVSSDGRYVLVYNGETYNFGAIRDALAAKGVRFRTESDTETILEAFVHWGIRPTLERMAGMAALAVWDRERKVLTLARDRFGEKPLYYGLTHECFVFASELKAITAAPGFAPRLDPTSVHAFFRYGFIPSPHSIWAGIHKLPPGTYLEIKPGATRNLPAPTTYWDSVAMAHDARQKGFSNGQAEASVEAALAMSVREALVADVPVGVFLSGGIDSSLIAALGQEQSPHPARTFTIGFEDAVFNEAANGRAVAEHLGTHHTEFVVTAEDCLAVVPQLPGMYDEPFADSSQIPTHLVSRLAREHVTVALSGDGGDELFGGYNRHVDGAQWAERLAHMPRPLRQGLGAIVQAPGPRAMERFGRVLAPRNRPGRFAEKVQKLGEAMQEDDPYEAFVRCWSETENPAGATESPAATATTASPEWTSAADRMMLRDTMSYLPDDILTKVDRASMAISLEVRAPFLRHEVFEAAWQTPIREHIHGGQGKQMLRRILRKRVPPALTDRPKTGFAVPLDDWLRGPLHDWAAALITPDALQATGLHRIEPIQKKWADHQAGRRNWYHQLWAVLMFQQWFQSTFESVRTDDLEVARAA